jgi:hypothetical protein
MARCKDPALNYLGKQGYNVVRLPRAGIAPLDVLGRDRRTIERLGSLDRIWKSGQDAPGVSDPQPAANIDGRKTSKLNLSIGLKFLSDVLGAMGAELPELGFAYKRAKTLQFTITNVHAVSIPPFQLGEFLAEGDLDTRNPFVSRYFVDEDTDAFVIFETLTSDAITVAAETSSGQEISLDVPAIQQTVGANVEVSVQSDSSRSVTYKGETPLTFGFKAFQVEFVDGRWEVESVKPSADTAFEQGPPRSDLDTQGSRVILRTTL